MALKRIAMKNTKAAKTCINCNTQLVKNTLEYVDKKVYKCPGCGKSQLIQIHQGRIINTDLDYIKRMMKEREKNGTNKANHR